MKNLWHMCFLSHLRMASVSLRYSKMLGLTQCFGEAESGNELYLRPIMTVHHQTINPLICKSFRDVLFDIYCWKTDQSRGFDFAAVSTMKEAGKVDCLWIYQISFFVILVRLSAFSIVPICCWGRDDGTTVLPICYKELTIHLKWLLIVLRRQLLVIVIGPPGCNGQPRYSEFIFAGQFEGAMDGDISRLKSIAVGLLSDCGCNASSLSEDLVAGICRCGAAELHDVAAFIGGIASQEVIKLITRQFVPMVGTFVFNGIDHKSQLLSL